MAFELDLQGAILSELKKTISTPIFDAPGQSQSYPYIVIGDDSLINDDTNTTIGRNVISSIHVWDNFNGYSRIKGIIGAIDDALNRVLFTVPNHHLIDCSFDSSSFFIEPDGKTRHGVISFKILIDRE